MIGSHAVYPERSRGVRTIFEDEHILVLDKPSGLVVDRSDTHSAQTLEDILRDEYKISLERGGIVHRLDKDTSGVILIAKTQQALENLQAQFKERKTKKEYWALVHGIVTESGRIEGNIGRNPGNREKFTVLEGDGKEAVTEYEPIKSLQFTGDRLQEIFSGFNKIQMRKLSTTNYNLFTLLKCKPKTGRTHQIRVHLKHIGFPIVSDEKYVGRKTFRLDKRWCARMFLHAKKIGFYHPETKKWMEMESELPKDLRLVLTSFEQYSSSD